LSTPISLTQLSAEIVSTQNNVPLGNVSINQPINIDPGANTIVNLTGTLNQDTVNQLTSQISNGTNLSSLNIALQNVNVDIDGITVHMNQIKAGEIPSLG
jgi:LEA14-like dessication related protein